MITTDQRVRFAKPSETDKLLILTVLSAGAFEVAIVLPFVIILPRNFSAIGGLAVAWYILWIRTVSNNPAEDKFISEAERSYLKEKITHAKHETVRQITFSKKYALFVCMCIWYTNIQ